MGTRKLWVGEVPITDDFGAKINKTFIDGRTKLGPWAMMTPANHKKYGVGLGLGRGQQYDLQEDGKWEQPASVKARKEAGPDQGELI